MARGARPPAVADVSAADDDGDSAGAERRVADDELEARVQARTQELSQLVATLQREVAAARRTEAELQDIRVFLDLVIENIPAMVFAKDAKEHRFLLVNRAGEELLGIGRSELIGKNDYDFFPKEQADHFVARDREVLESGGLQETPEEPIDTRDKGQRWLHTRKIPVPDEQGRPKFLLVLIEDITERRNAEAALQASEARLRSLLAASPDALIVVDPAGRIALASRRVEAMFGHAPEALVGQPFAVLLPERHHGIYAEQVRQLTGASQRASVGVGQDLRALRKDGSEFPAEITMSPSRADEGLVIIAAVRDITDRRAIETQLRQAQKMEAVGQLTGGMAHDFNNLLAVVVGNLDLLEEELAAHPKARSLAQTALTASLKGAELTRQLLAFSRKQTLEPAVFALNKLVSGMTQLLRRSLGERVDVRMVLGEELWPVVADPSQVESALVNLAINARDAMPEGGALTIETANSHLDERYCAENPDAAPGDYVMLAVSDTGTGIPPAILERVFEPFFTTKGEGKGSGLGLSMVYGFARQSHGHVKIYSEVGHGTTIRLYLPRASAAAASAAEAARLEPEVRPREASILVVEDNEDVRRIVVQQLSEQGYRIAEAATGDAALEILKQDRPIDLLFTDVVMPGRMTGDELARQARVLRPGLKVLFTSGFAAVPGRDGARSADINRDNLLSKPYRRQELVRRIHQALHGDEAK
jgi:two-component system, cell cycle sensor histidine kinase and response regulator CckA